MLYVIGRKRLAVNANEVQMGWIFDFCFCMFQEIGTILFSAEFRFWSKSWCQTKKNEPKKNMYDEVAGKSFQGSQHDVKITSSAMSENRIGL